MKRSVEIVLVLLLLYTENRFCDVIVNNENEYEGSLCHLKNRTRGICQSFCDGQNWIHFKDDICNPRQYPTLYCCVDHNAANSYPTLYEICMNSSLAETIEGKRKIRYFTAKKRLDWMEENYQYRNGVFEESCHKTALKIEEDERRNFLKYCLKIKEIRSPTIHNLAEFRRVDYTSMVGIGRYDDGHTRWICTGHFIHPLYVLTSAHCILEQPCNSCSNTTGHSNSPNIIRYGRLDLSDEGFYTGSRNSTSYYSIDEIIVADLYDKVTLDFDLALLKVVRDLESESNKALHLKPIPTCLWTKETVPTKNLFLLAYSSVFHKGEVTLVNRTECDRKLKVKSFGGARGCYLCNFENKDTLIASLHYSENHLINSPYLVGIGSCGLPCKGNEPAHFTLVYPYLRWIEAIINRE